MDVWAEVRVATYNVFTGMHDTEQTAAVICKTNADIVALQEVAPQAAVMLDRALAADFKHRSFSNGLVILSRHPIRNTHFLRSEQGINGFLFAEIDHPQGRIQVANLHLDPIRTWTFCQKLTLPIQLLWQQGSIQRSEIAQVSESLQPDLPTIVLGDFNRVSDAATSKLHKLGFVDSFAAVTQKPDNTHTLHFSILGFQVGRRVDFIFHDRSFETTESHVVSGRPSDHDPVVSVLYYRRSSEMVLIPF